MAVKIIYFVHGTTTDNEKGIATGWSPGELSELGKKQCMELRAQTKGKKFNAIFCSDLKRAVDSARLTWEGVFPIIQDRRLRECDYGELTGEPSKKVDSMAVGCIDKPFTGGESYRGVEGRVRNFLDFLLDNYSGSSIAIVAHRAPQLVLDVIIKGKTWK